MHFGKLVLKRILWPIEINLLECNFACSHIVCSDVINNLWSCDVTSTYINTCISTNNKRRKSPVEILRYIKEDRNHHLENNSDVGST